MRPLLTRNKPYTQPHKVLLQFWQDLPLNCFYNDLKTVGKDMMGQNKSAVQKPGLVE